METKEHKEILLKDICPRLPYGLFVYDEKAMDKDVLYTYYYHPNIENVKPYLRPMSTMMVEEAEKLEQIAKETLGEFMFLAEEDGGAIYHFSKWKIISPEMFDYLNTIHIDYRGLIPMGLALPAPEGMYTEPMI